MLTRFIYKNYIHFLSFLEYYGKVPEELSDISAILLSFISYIGTYSNLYKEFIKYFFEGKKEAITIINEIFSESMELKYTIIPNIDMQNKTYLFQEIFKIIRLNDFMKFDTLKIIEIKININICENCGKYFIPKNKSNEKYCNNIFKSGKTCRELSYQLKFNNDKVEQLYRSSYKTPKSKEIII